MSSSEQAPEPTMDEILASIRRIIADDESQNVPAPRPAPMVQRPVASAPQPPKQSASSRLVAEMEDALNRTAKRADSAEPEDILELTDEVFEAPEPPMPPPMQPMGRGGAQASMQPPKAAPMPAPPPPDDDLDLMADDIDLAAPPPPPQSGPARSSVESLGSTPLRMPPRPEATPSFAPTFEVEDDARETEQRPAQKPFAIERESMTREAVKGSSTSLEDVVRELLRPQLREWLDEHLPRILEDAVREELSSQIQERRRRH